MNGYEDVDRNMFFKLKEGSRTRRHKAALVKEQSRLDMRKYSFSQWVINEWNKLPNDWVNSVNMFKNRNPTSSSLHSFWTSMLIAIPQQFRYL